MKYLLLIICLAIAPVYAGDSHHHNHEPINVPDNDSNHNVLWMGAVIAVGVCAYYRCWKPKPVKAESRITPEVPRNEYTYTIKP